MTIDLALIKVAIAAAQEGPWVADIDDPKTEPTWTGKFYCGYDGGTWCTYNDEPLAVANLRFIDLARTAMSLLVAEVEALRRRDVPARKQRPTERQVYLLQLSARLASELCQRSKIDAGSADVCNLHELSLAGLGYVDSSPQVSIDAIVSHVEAQLGDAFRPADDDSE